MFKKLASKELKLLRIKLSGEEAPIGVDTEFVVNERFRKTMRLDSMKLKSN